MDNHKFRCILFSYDEIVMSNAATLKIESEKPEILSTHQDQTIYSTNNCEALLPDYTKNIVATDNCDANLDITQTPAPGTSISGTTNQVILTVTDIAGNSESVSFNVAIEDNTAPSIECNENQTVVISGRKSSYTVSRTEFDPVSIDDNCGVTILENDFNHLPTLAGAVLPIGKTSINWIVTDQAGNTASCSSEVIVCIKTRMSDLSNSGISIYPNPTNGMFQIEFGNNKIEKIKISDLSGNTIIEKTEIRRNETIDLSQFKNGIYTISIQTDIEIFTSKIVKE